MAELLVDNPSAAADPTLPDAFVTLLTAPSYLPGALALLHALHELHPAPRHFKIACLVTPETVDAATVGALRNAGYDVVIGVEPIASGQRGQTGLHLMGRPDLDLALTKLHIFRLGSMFKTVFYMDADTLPIRPLSHLFRSTAPHILSACPDVGWPDCFNSGVMVIRPRLSDFENLRQLMAGDDSGGNGSFDGADQGLLNHYFSDEGAGGPWNRLPFTYNVTPSTAYQYMPAFKRFAHKISVIHFIGPRKPWARLPTRPAGLGVAVNHSAPMAYEQLIDRWFDVYDRNVRPTAIHEPNLAKRFTVPENIAVWNRSRDGEGDHAARAGPAPVPGQYTSLPLDGRYDLMMPQPEPEPEHTTHATDPEHGNEGMHHHHQGSGGHHPAAPNAPPSAPTHADDQHQHQPHDHQHHDQHHDQHRDQHQHHDHQHHAPHHHDQHDPSPQHTPSPQYRQSAWDGSQGPPPKDSQPEMAIAVDSFYAPAWDEPTRSQGTYYQEHHDRFAMPTLPRNVLKNDWYGTFTGTVPNPDKGGSAFPWEDKGSTPRAEASRRFPRQRAPTPPPPVAPKAIKPSTPVEPAAHVQPTAPIHADPPLTPTQPAKPIPSFHEAMAEYTNAWDEDASIGRFAKRLTDLGIVSRRKTGGMHTVPPSPRRTSRHLAPAPRQDGADSTGHPPRPSYQDKGIQTEPPSLNDAIVQASPETSPFSETPPTVRKMVSVATTPVTPPSQQGSTRSGKTKPQTSYFPSPSPKRAPAKRAPRGRVWDPQTDIDVMRRHQALAQLGR